MCLKRPQNLPQKQKLLQKVVNRIVLVRDDWKRKRGTKEEVIEDVAVLRLQKCIARALKLNVAMLTKLWEGRSSSKTATGTTGSGRRARLQATASVRGQMARSRATGPHQQGHSVM